MNLIPLLISVAIVIINTIIPDSDLNNKGELIDPQIKSKFETEAQNFIHYSMASYCKLSDLKAWSCKPYCTGNSSKIIVETFKNPILNVTGYIAVNDIEKLIIISFRGSKNLQNWLTNIDALYKPVFVDNKFMLVHSGFWLNTNSVYDKVKDLLLVAKAKRPNYKIIFTGHSLGGALSALTILKLRQDNIVKWSEIKLITYAAPRIGDASLMDYFNSKNLISLRAYNPNDIVPNLPPNPLFRHFDYPLVTAKLTEKGENCQQEIIMDPVNCIARNDKLDFNHKFFWGKYYSSDCN